MNPPDTPIPPQLLTSLLASSFPIPSPTFLNPILHPPSQRPPPLPSLIATTKHRLLSTSLTTPHLLTPSTHSFPPNLSNPLTKQTTLAHDIPVQVLDILDISRSNSELLLELERERSGERIKGREVIRLIDSAASQMDSGTCASTCTASPNRTAVAPSPLAHSPGPFKLLFQDHTASLIYAFTSSPIAKVGFPPKMHIGCKIMLKRGTRVCRGVVWLEEEYCVVLGGRVESLDRVWREGWERRVREMVEKGRGGGGEGEEYEHA